MKSPTTLNSKIVKELKFETAAYMYNVCFLLYWELDRIFGIRADLSSRQYFFLGDMKI